MKPITLLCISAYLSCIMLLFPACDAIIEPSISKKNVTPEAPVNQYQSTSYTINFWWDQLDHALSYHLQAATPTFDAPNSLVLDTIVTKNTFSFNFNPGSYQWRVLAQNGSSQTSYTEPRSFTVNASSIKQQAVQLIGPANGFLTNQNPITFQWGSLFGATKYQLEIDTSNFANESVLIYNQTIPGQQISFTLPKDQNYQWRVKAQNDTVQAQWSAIYQVTYDHTPPTKVMLVSPADGSAVNLPVALQWNAVATASKYKLYVYKSDGTTIYNSTFPMVVNATTYNFNLGASGDKIYWVVTGVDPAGNESQASTLNSFSLK